jgi:hypothetical protein
MLSGIGILTGIGMNATGSLAKGCADLFIRGIEWYS